MRCDTILSHNCTQGASFRVGVTSDAVFRHWCLLNREGRILESGCFMPASRRREGAVRFVLERAGCRPHLWFSAQVRITGLAVVGARDGRLENPALDRCRCNDLCGSMRMRIRLKPLRRHASSRTRRTAGNLQLPSRLLFSMYTKLARTCPFASISVTSCTALRGLASSEIRLACDRRRIILAQPYHERSSPEQALNSRRLRSCLGAALASSAGRHRVGVMTSADGRRSSRFPGENCRGCEVSPTGKQSREGIFASCRIVVPLASLCRADGALITRSGYQGQVRSAG